MTPKVKQQIIEWIFDNHQHHSGASGVSMSIQNGSINAIEDESRCEDGDSPYVNSLELEKFISKIKETK